MTPEQIADLQDVLIAGGYSKTEAAKAHLCIKNAVELAKAVSFYEWAKVDRYNTKMFNPEYYLATANKDVMVAEARVTLLKALEAWHHATR